MRTSEPDAHEGEPVERVTPATRAAEWIEWVGFGRLVTSALAVVVVCLGGYWLLRTPPPATEALLPMASQSTAPTSVTSSVTTSTTMAAPLTVTVHVAGAVVSPGVFELSGLDRVADAVGAAGGATAEGNADELNLAAPLTDGTRIYVPMQGETLPTTTVTIADLQHDSIPTGPVNVNTASGAQLDGLPGVGPSTAAAIIAERERNGPFLGVDDLDRVPGIGPAKLEAIRDLVTT